MTHYVGEIVYYSKMNSSELNGVIAIILDSSGDISVRRTFVPGRDFSHKVGEHIIKRFGKGGGKLNHV